MSFLCKYCGSIWLHTDPEVRSSTGKCIPLTESNLPHDCHLSPFMRRKKTFAKAVGKVAVNRIDDYQVLDEAREYIEFANSRLQHYKLTLSIVEKKQTVLEELL